MKMKSWKKAMLILLMLALSLIFVSPILLLLNSSFKELNLSGCAGTALSFWNRQLPGSV